MGGARAPTRGKGQASGANREATVSERLGPRAADRVLEILDLLARRRRGLSLGDISRLLDIPKASLSDLLKPLVARSYIDRDENGHFSIGPATTALARAIVFSGELVDLARPFLEQLVRVTGETVLIASLDEASMVTVYIDKVEPDSPIRYTVPIGLRRELHATSVGKVFLAHLPNRRVEQFFARQNLESFTPRTLTDPGALRAELEQVRKTGVAVTEDERTPGASGIAAPIFDVHGRIVAGLSLAGPTSRVRPVRKRLVGLVRETAREISAVVASTAAAVPPNVPSEERRVGNAARK